MKPGASSCAGRVVAREYHLLFDRTGRDAFLSFVEDTMIVQKNLTVDDSRPSL